jgi:hypothetical protein
VGTTTASAIQAVEIIVNAGGLTPLWIGVITKAWIWLMEWGGIPDNYMSEYIREIRGIIYDICLCARVMEGEMHNGLLT